MRILALDTSTESGSCALWQDGTLIERVCPPGVSHSETLLPLIRDVLASAEIAVSRLDAIAFGCGPGAFTGLRVACGIAQGLAVAADLPVVPVGSLESMAEQCPADRVLSLLDARMGEIYVGRCLRTEHGWAMQGARQVLSPSALRLDDQPTHGELACGNALKVFPELMARLHDQGWQTLPDILPTAAAVARLGAIGLTNGAAVDPAQAAPLYIRDKVAKTVAERLGEGGKA